MSEWKRKSRLLPTGLSPTPWGKYLFYAVLDANNRGHIEKVELEWEGEALRVASAPERVLSPGPKGGFDDDGVVPASVLDGKFFYSGFHRTEKAPYEVFAGAAELDPQTGRLKRTATEPVLGRSAGGEDFRAACFVLPGDEAGFQAWYPAGTKWVRRKDGSKVPRYEMQLVRRWSGARLVCFEPDEKKGEIGFSRPWVVREAGGFRMFYSVRTLSAGYTRIESRFSSDGMTWPSEVRTELLPSGEGWDSQMVCYPAYAKVGSVEVLFYSGNENGKAGLGYAVREGLK